MAAPITETAFLAAQASTYQQAVFQGASTAVAHGATNPSVTPSADTTNRQNVEWIDQYLSRIGRDPGRANGPFS